MRQNYEYLNNTDFLFALAKEKITNLFVKIIVLTMNEKPIKEIQGRVLSGNINVDGNSSVRRTGNLSVFIDERDASYMEVGGLFSINKKIKIEIGIENRTAQYSEYPILWFPQGVFAIVNLSSSHGTSGTNISLQIKDKMAYLNGECGGIISSSVVFDEYDIINPETGEYAIEKPTIVQIIQELVNHFGGEQLGKIIISDLDTRVKKVMKWTQSNYLYYYVDGKTNILTLTPVRVSDSKTINKIQQQIDEEEGKFLKLDSAEYTEADWNKIVQEYNDKITAWQEQQAEETLKIRDEWGEGDSSYVLVKTFSAGDDVGYIYSDFYFPKELVGNAGDSVCTILDTIKNTLGNFEYFYDLHGNFIFQEVKNYLNTSQSTNALNSGDASNYLVDRTKGKAAYDFSNSEIITSFSNSPQYANVKNDFMVWGMRETVNGKTIPIRYHLAIDSKPKVGNTYQYHFFDDPESLNLADLEPIRKARLAIEIDPKKGFPNPGEIGRVYIDPEQNPQQGYYWDKDKYIVKKVECKNRLMFPSYPTEAEKKLFYTITGTNDFYKWNEEAEGYVLTNDYKEDKRPLEAVEVPAVSTEFLDILEDGDNIFLHEELATRITKDADGDNIDDTKIEYRTYYHPTEFKTRTTEDWREELYFSGVNTTRLGTDSNYYYTELENEWTKLYDYDIENPTWKEEVLSSPSELDFFLDFIDSNAKVSEFSIANIGRRTHVVNDDSINCIFEPEIPDFILIEEDDPEYSTKYTEADLKGQKWMGISSNVWAGLAQGGSYNSAFNMIQDLLYQYTGYNETISLQILPMYFLEPNTRILVRDSETGINGDYMLNNFSIPLDINGTMSLSCTKALERI